MVPNNPVDWSLILGDFLTNLRAALDHLAWQLVILEGGTPDKSTQFPIRETEVNAKGNPSPTKVKGISDVAVLAAIEAAQPFKAIRPREQPLYTLNALVNNDKHRLLLVVAHALRVTGMWWSNPEGQEPPEIRLNLGPLSDGDPVAWFDFGDKPAPANFEPHLELELRLKDGPPVGENTLQRPAQCNEHALYDRRALRGLAVRPLLRRERPPPCIHLRAMNAPGRDVLEG